MKPIPERLFVNPALIRRHLHIRLSQPPTVQQVPRPLPNPATPTSIRAQHIVQPARRPQQPLVRHVSRSPLTADATSRIERLRNCGSGRILIIVANGPSILEVPLQLLSNQPGIDLMSINKPDPRLWPTQYWAFCDLSQYRRHLQLWNDYTGTIINSTAITASRPGSIHIRNLGGKGFSRNLIQGFHVGRSTVFANMQTAHYMGYDQIYLFGVDMLADQAGPLWFYGTNPDVTPEVRRSRFQLEAEFYTAAAQLLTPQERQRYIFCSSYNPWEFTHQYQRWDHQGSVERILASRKLDMRPIDTPQPGQ